MESRTSLQGIANSMKTLIAGLFVVALLFSATHAQVEGDLCPCSLLDRPTTECARLSSSADTLLCTLGTCGGRGYECITDGLILDVCELVVSSRCFFTEAIPVDGTTEEPCDCIQTLVPIPASSFPDSWTVVANTPAGRPRNCQSGCQSSGLTCVDGNGQLQEVDSAETVILAAEAAGFTCDSTVAMPNTDGVLPALSFENGQTICHYAQDVNNIVSTCQAVPGVNSGVQRLCYCE